MTDFLIREDTDGKRNHREIQLKRPFADRDRDWTYTATSQGMPGATQKLEEAEKDFL